MLMPSDARHAHASMGNYLFQSAVLRDALRDAARHGEHDFGRDVLSRLVDTRRVFAYDLERNVDAGRERLRGEGLLARRRHA